VELTGGLKRAGQFRYDSFIPDDKIEAIDQKLNENNIKI